MTTEDPIDMLETLAAHQAAVAEILGALFGEMARAGPSPRDLAAVLSRLDVLTGRPRVDKARKAMLASVRAALRTGGKALRVAHNERGFRVGETHHRAKLSDADVALIIELREAGLTYDQIVKKFDDGVPISRTAVRKICACVTRAQIPDRWRKL